MKNITGYLLPVVFIKQKFELEDLRVRSLNSIRNLNLIILIASGYISLMSEKYEKIMV